MKKKNQTKNSNFSIGGVIFMKKITFEFIYNRLEKINGHRETIPNENDLLDDEKDFLKNDEPKSKRKIKGLCQNSA